MTEQIDYVSYTMKDAIDGLWQAGIVCQLQVDSQESYAQAFADELQVNFKP